MKAFILGSLIFVLLLLTIFHNSFASTYTLTWCPVKSATWYVVCIDKNQPQNNICNYPIGNISTTYVFNTNLNNVWIRVQAIKNDGYGNLTFSQWSNTIQIINGITPPIINCGC